MSKAIMLNGLGGGRSDVVLPDGYTRLLYLQSTGTQWIDTGVNVHIDTVIESCDALVGGSGYQGLWGLSSSGNKKFLQSSNQRTLQFWTDIGTGDLQTNVGLDGALYRAGWWGRTIILPNGGTFEIKVRSSKPSFTAVDDPRYTLTIFAFRNMDSTDASVICKYGRIYQFGVLENDQYLIKLFPARNSDGVAGMFDIINQRFLTNSGTGEFVIGEMN